MVRKKDLSIETLSGIKHCRVTTTYGFVSRVTVDMGKAELTPALIPVRSDKEIVVDEPAVIGGKDYRITCVSMGNPHCVVFCDSVDALNLPEIGPLFEHDSLFPERVNTEFIERIDDHTLKMRVWERGSGETLACGTGACASVVAAVLNGFCRKGEDVRVDAARRRSDDQLPR